MPAPGHPSGAKKILIVDDVAVNTLLLEELLRGLGEVDPVSFTVPESALHWCQTNEPDLVLLDVVMPSMNGLEMLGHLRGLSHLADVPIIMVTGLEDRESRLRSLDLGANDFVLKPYDGVELLARSRSMLRLRAATQEQRRLAATDDLTGLPNRRHFLARMEEEIKRVKRVEGRPLSLAALDVDHFKQINDTHGHAAGDAVLVQLARLCRDRVREIDVPGRLGGEEFAVLMPETALSGALVACERLRRGIEDAALPVPGGTIRITVSLGVTQFQPGDTADSVLSRADRALYRAKEGGRNRTSE